MSLLSEVELNQDLVQVGHVLFYTDGANCQKWNVTSRDENTFTATDVDGNSDIFVFDELQYGWSFSETTKITFGFDLAQGKDITSYVYTEDGGKTIHQVNLK